MSKLALIASCAVCVGLVAAPAFAQTVEQHTTVVKKKPGGATAGAATGAVAGAVVAGPVGAVVGGVAGAVVGNSVAPPTEVRTYVVAQNVAPAAYSEEIVVGRPIDGDVVWLDVPDYPRYRWAYLNGRRVVVDARTHAVVAVY